MLAVIALIRAVLVKAFASIQLAPVLSAIAPRLPPLHWTVTWPGQQAVLQELDLPRLLGASSPP